MPRKIRSRGNGSYQLTVAIGYNNQGKQIIKTKTIRAASDREAAKAYNLFAAEVERGEVAYTGKCKLEDFAEEWFQRHCRKNLAPKTQRTYQNHLKNRILPALGYLDISKIRPQHIMDFVDGLEDGKRYDGREGTLSGESARYCFRVLSSMMQDAVQWQVIPSNPCARVKPPTTERKRVQDFDEGEISRMVELLAKEPLKYRMIIMLALDSGLRLGELMGLQWEDIDFENRKVDVNKSNQALRGEGIFTKAPKNQSSVRQVIIAESTVKLLRQYRQEQLEQRLALEGKWTEGGWVFTQWNGLPMYPTTPSQWFRKFLKRNSLPHMPFHALRHLSATLMISFGIPLKNVSSRLGHADIRTTANIYGVALESIDKQAADKMDDFIQGVGKHQKMK